ncbi:TIGR02391 family protein [Corynebacterium pseudodiphtheriticum]|uniref:TIGR02391 family protein n=1 Tax=Corynebacterium pseudodiphtheriticum TaxID=37637 RepID=UPI0025518F8C|nr:TIGR02391 family protein [Corynebacterium pseudodiphtheriticum]MDK8563242.1 TIGR02391 family protein [Corynebacterium pseudodiphtheriticum]
MTTNSFPPATLTALARAIGHTEHGLTCGEIGQLLHRLNMFDPGETTKWKRLEASFTHSQNTRRNADRIITFVTHVFDPGRYVSDPELFDTRRRLVRPVLVLHGLKVGDAGKVVRTKYASSLSDVQRLTSTVREELTRRGTHEKVLAYCEEEILRHGFLHAILEASKSVFQGLRNMTGLDCDSAKLAEAALSVKSGVLGINSLRSKTERNEQAGLCSLVTAIGGLYRNPPLTTRGSTEPSPKRNCTRRFRCCRMFTDDSTTLFQGHNERPHRWWRGNWRQGFVGNADLGVYVHAGQGVVQMCHQASRASAPLSMGALLVGCHLEENHRILGRLFALVHRGRTDQLGSPKTGALYPGKNHRILVTLFFTGPF